MVVRGSGKNERAETHQGMGGDVVMETGPGWAGWGWAREEGEAHLDSSRGAPLSSSGLGPDSLAAPAAGASSGSGSAAIYGAWMGRGGGSSSSPGTDRLVGRRGEGQGYCLGGSHRTRGGGWAGGGSEAGPPQTQ